MAPHSSIAQKNHSRLLGYRKSWYSTGLLATTTAFFLLRKEALCFSKCSLRIRDEEWFEAAAHLWSPSSEQNQTQWPPSHLIGICFWLILVESCLNIEVSENVPGCHPDVFRYISFCSSGADVSAGSSVPLWHVAAQAGPTGLPWFLSKQAMRKCRYSGV